MNESLNLIKLSSLNSAFQDQGIWTCSAKNKHGVSQTKSNVLAQVSSLDFLATDFFGDNVLLDFYVFFLWFKVVLFCCHCCQFMTQLCQLVTSHEQKSFLEKLDKTVIPGWAPR